MADVFALIDVGQKIVAKELIDILKQRLVWYKSGKIHPVTKGSNSKTVVFRGFNRLALALTPLNEAVTPAGTDLSMNTVNAVLAQYGDYTIVSTLMEFLYDRGSAFKDASTVLGIQAQETIDTVIMNVVGANTNIIYGDGTVTTPVTVTSSMKMTSTLITRDVRWLERNNVEKFDSPAMQFSSAYALVVHPDVVADIRMDSSWIAAVNYSSPSTSNNKRGDLFTGELGYWQGVRIVSSTMTPFYAGAGASGINLYGSICFGKGAYGVSEIAGGLQTYIHSSGVQSLSDPLEQRATVGWMWTGTAAILDNNRIVRNVTAATYSSSNA